MTLPTEPNCSPDMIVFTNLMRMIKQEQHTAESANIFLDQLDIAPHLRFWGVGLKVDPKSGGAATVYFNWRDGAWVNGQEQIKAENRKDMNVQPKRLG